MSFSTDDKAVLLLFGPLPEYLWPAGVSVVSSASQPHHVVLCFETAPPEAPSAPVIVVGDVYDRWIEREPNGHIVDLQVPMHPPDSSNKGKWRSLLTRLVQGLAQLQRGRAVLVWGPENAAVVVLDDKAGRTCPPIGLDGLLDTNGFAPRHENVLRYLVGRGLVDEHLIASALYPTSASPVPLLRPVCSQLRNLLGPNSLPARNEAGTQLIELGANRARWGRNNQEVTPGCDESSGSSTSLEQVTEGAQHRTTPTWLEPPTLHWDLARIDSLEPRLERTPFCETIRRNELSLLTAWCETTKATSFGRLGGTGGTGKTRLAMQLCHMMASQGWNAGFLTIGHGRRVSVPLLETDTDSLLVIDDSGSRPEDVADVLAALRTRVSRCRVRVLLLDRYSLWMGAARLEKASGLVMSTRVRQLDMARYLSSDVAIWLQPLDEEERGVFRGHLGLASSPESTDLDTPLALLAAAQANEESLQSSLDFALERELSRAFSLLGESDRHARTLLERVLCLVTASSGLRKHELFTTLKLVSEEIYDWSGTLREIQSCLLQCFYDPGRDLVVGVQPDLVGERLILSVAPTWKKLNRTLWRLKGPEAVLAAALRFPVPILLYGARIESVVVRSSNSGAAESARSRQGDTSAMLLVDEVDPFELPPVEIEDVRRALRPAADRGPYERMTMREWMRGIVDPTTGASLSLAARDAILQVRPWDQVPEHVLINALKLLETTQGFNKLCQALRTELKSRR